MIIAEQISRAEISFIVKEVIQYKLGLEENQLTDSAQFKDDLGVDSLDLIELEMELEKKFNIAIQDEELERLTTVGSFISFIQEKKSYGGEDGEDHHDSLHGL